MRVWAESSGFWNLLSTLPLEQGEPLWTQDPTVREPGVSLVPVACQHGRHHGVASRPSAALRSERRLQVGPQASPTRCWPDGDEKPWPLCTEPPSILGNTRSCCYSGWGRGSLLLPIQTALWPVPPQPCGTFVPEGWPRARPQEHRTRPLPGVRARSGAHAACFCFKSPSAWRTHFVPTLSAADRCVNSCI